jgi:hypothetical protein
LESFAHPPHLIVEDAEEFLDWYLVYMTRAEINEWVRRREWFIQVLEAREEASGIQEHQISRMIRSRSSYFASVLDKEGIGGMQKSLEEKYFR